MRQICILEYVATCRKVPCHCSKGIIPWSCAHTHQSARLTGIKQRQRKMLGIWRNQAIDPLSESCPWARSWWNTSVSPTLSAREEVFETKKKPQLLRQLISGQDTLHTHISWKLLLFPHWWGACHVMVHKRHPETVQSARCCEWHKPILSGNGWSRTKNSDICCLHAMYSVRCWPSCCLGELTAHRQASIIACSYCAETPCTWMHLLSWERKAVYMMRTQYLKTFPGQKTPLYDDKSSLKCKSSVMWQ